MPTGATPRIAVVVVSFNTRELLDRCLAAFGDDTRLDVHVVDNGSRDGSVEHVRNRFSHVTVHVAPVNLGFGAAVNLGADAAGDWDWLVVANADAAPRAGAIDALLDAGAHDPTAGVLAPRLMRPDDTTQHSVHTFWSVRFAAAYAAGRRGRDGQWAYNHALEGSFAADRSRRVPWAVGAFLLIRRPAWDAVGGFNPHFWLYGEDLDLGWCLGQVGWPTRYAPAALVDHHEAASTRPAWGDERAKASMAASYEWMHLRRGALEARTTAALNVAGDLARWRGRASRRAYAGWASHHAVGLLPRAALRHRLARPG